jgi:O-antigen ligase
VAGLVMLWALIYTGSRTSTIIVPIGVFFVTFLLLKRNVLIAFGVGCVLAAGVILKPSGNQALFIMLTALEGKDDPSLNVRLENQQLIQRYVKEAPIGYGLGSTGDIGRRFSPGSFIGSFPPDSEYVKIAVETGWIGLFIWCTLQFLFFRRGVIFYFRIKNSTSKYLIAVPISLLFMNIVAQYPQELLRMQVMAMLFAISLAIIERLALINENK